MENEGVPPDVEVEQWPADVIAGSDPQLEKAIEIVLEELKKNPPKKPQRPPFPVRVEEVTTVAGRGRRGGWPGAHFSLPACGSPPKRRCRGVGGLGWSWTSEPPRSCPGWCPRRTRERAPNGFEVGLTLIVATQRGGGLRWLCPDGGGGGRRPLRWLRCLRLLLVEYPRLVTVAASVRDDRASTRHPAHADRSTSLPVAGEGAALPSGRPARSARSAPAGWSAALGCAGAGWGWAAACHLVCGCAWMAWAKGPVRPGCCRASGSPPGGRPGRRGRLSVVLWNSLWPTRICCSRSHSSMSIRSGSSGGAGLPTQYCKISLMAALSP